MLENVERLQKVIEELNLVISELKREEDDWKIENAQRILEYSEKRIFLAEKMLNEEISMPFPPSDTPEHVLGKEYLLRYLGPKSRIPWEIPLPLGGSYKPDAIIKVGDVWGILEVETNPKNCEKDFKGVERLIQNPEKLRHNMKTIQDILDEVKKQILGGFPIMLYLGFIKGTKGVAKEDIKFLISMLKKMHPKVNVKVYLIDVRTGEISEIGIE